MVPENSFKLQKQTTTEDKLVRLRLTRMGRKKRPFYRIVAVDSRTRRDGAYLEKIGQYNPVAHTGDEENKVDHELALKWLLCGAQPSDTVRAIFSKNGIMLKFDMISRIKKEKVGEKYKAVRDENGNTVRLYTDEQVEEAYQNWLTAQEAKKERLASKKGQKLSRKAKAKLEEAKSAE